MLVFTSVFGINTSAATTTTGKSVSVTQEDFKLTKHEETEIKNFGKNLVNDLREVDLEEYEEVISGFVSINNNSFDEKLNKVLSEQVEDGINKKVLKKGDENVSLKVDQNVINSNMETFDIDAKNQLILTPTHIIISELIQDDNEFSVMSTNTVPGRAVHTMYNKYGYKLMTITVESKFSYNGSRATYHSGFDYFYDRGFLSIWTVSGWRGWKEPVGTSYQARAGGTFDMGLQVKGVGLVLDSTYIRVTLKCDKNGNLSRYHYYSNP